MKKLIPYLSSLVLILATFSFMNVSLAQGKQIKAPATNSVLVAQQQIAQPAVEQPKVEAAKNDASHSLNFEFGYDFLAKFEKIKFKNISDIAEAAAEDEDFSPLTSSDESAKYMSLKLSMNFFTEMFRLGFGLGFILPHDYDNKVVSPIETVDGSIEQKFNFGINLQLIQFGYKIDLDPIELIPYVGLNLLYLKAEDSVKSNEEGENEDTVELHKLLIPLCAGLDVVFAKAGPMSFYAGLELGYAIKVLYKNDAKDLSSDYSDLIADESDPLTGLMGKISIGTAFNF